MSELKETHHAGHAHTGHGHDAHAHDPHDAGQPHVHGYNSFLDRWWQAFVIGLGCIGVFILSHYNPVGN